MKEPFEADKIPDVMVLEILGDNTCIIWVFLLGKPLVLDIIHPHKRRHYERYHLEYH